MDRDKKNISERRHFRRAVAQDKWTMAAIESRDIHAYQRAIMHDWLRTLTVLTAVLIPCFFVLDIFMMPSALLTEFAFYRAVSTTFTIIQMIAVYRTDPGRLSYIHGYLLSFHVGGMISLMTADLGGFTSSYYAGLNLVIIGATLLMPWREIHTFNNCLLIIVMYLGINLLSGHHIVYSSLMNNLFFMGATSVLSIGISFVRYRLIHKEFSLLIDLDKTQEDLKSEKEIVEEKTRSLKSLLDVSGQGFLSFDSDFRISSEYSRECMNIFRREIEGIYIDELLYEDPEKRDDFRMGLSLFFEGKTRPDVIFDHLDSRFKIGDKTVSAAYKAVHANSVMIILTDITEEIRLQEEARRENEKWQMLRKVITNRPAFGIFDREARRFFAEVVRREKNFSSLLPVIHTIKGNAGFLGFIRTQEAAHNLEDALGNQSAMGEDFYPAEEIDSFTASFSDEMSDVTDTLGPSWRIDVDLVELPKSEFTLIENHIRTYCPNPAIMNVIEEHKKKPLNELMSRFPKMAAQIAERLAKRIAPVKIIGGEISVIADEFEELIDSFSHIIRNCVDHGIELPVEREQMGKPLSGIIGIEIEESPAEIIFKFSDDGRGIQFERIEKRARELGYIGIDEKPTTQDFLSIIFWDSFSTAPKVSNLSGRGVGLAAVRAAVKKLGGQIKMKTWKDHGTIITIIIPKIRHQAVEN